MGARRTTTRRKAAHAGTPRPRRGRPLAGHDTTSKSAARNFLTKKWAATPSRTVFLRAGELAVAFADAINTIPVNRDKRRAYIAERVDAFCLRFPEIQRVDVLTYRGLHTRTHSGWLWNETIPFGARDATRGEPAASNVPRRGDANRGSVIGVHNAEAWVPLLVENLEVTDEMKRRLGEAIGQLYLRMRLGSVLRDPPSNERHHVFIELCKRAAAALEIKPPTVPECVHIAVAVGIDPPNSDAAKVITRWEKRLGRAAR